MPHSGTRWRRVTLGLGMAAALGCQSSGGPRGSTLNGTNSTANSWWPPSFVRGRQRVPSNPYDYNERGRERDRLGDPFVPASAEIKEGKDSRSSGSGSGGGGSTSLHLPRLDPAEPRRSPGTLELVGGIDADRGRTPNEPSALQLTSAKEDGVRDRLATVTAQADVILAPPVPAADYRAIIIRETGSGSDTLDSLAREHEERFGVRGSAWHFVIPRRASARGEWIGVGPRWRNQQPAARIDGDESGRADGAAIVIGVAGRFATESPGEGQRDAVRELVSALASRYRIPPHQIMTRSDSARESASRSLEADPGPLFRLDEILAAR